MHKTLLNNNKHENRLLQRDWNLYGKSNFIFIILFYYEANDTLAEMEFRTIMQYSYFPGVYNIHWPDIRYSYYPPTKYYMRALARLEQLSDYSRLTR